MKKKLLIEILVNVRIVYRLEVGLLIIDIDMI